MIKVGPGFRITFRITSINLMKETWSFRSFEKTNPRDVYTVRYTPNTKEIFEVDSYSIGNIFSVWLPEKIYKSKIQVSLISYFVTIYMYICIRNLYWNPTSINFLYPQANSCFDVIALCRNNGRVISRNQWYPRTTSIPTPYINIIFPDNTSRYKTLH